ncbi:hypothetical protein TNCV_2269241, partial [Trichonephila clavipes]
LGTYEDSVSGLCSHMNLKCKNCSFFKRFPYDREDERFLSYKLFNCFGARIIGNRFSAGKSYVLPRFTIPVKLAFPNQKKTVESNTNALLKNINAALTEIKGSNSFTKCGISIDGTWQRRGYSSLNGV